jgi:hypothetical protein
MILMANCIGELLLSLSGYEFYQSYSNIPHNQSQAPYYLIRILHIQ